MQVQELSTSINGELPYIGTPTSILRLAGCNLTCDYCDAPNEAGVEMTPGLVFESLVTMGHRRVLITGGEPLLQLEELRSLSLALYSAEFEILYETNGTINLETLRPFGSFAVDVKMFDLSTFKLENLVYLGPEDALKFVYSGQDELSLAFDFIHANVPLGAPYMIVFSPTDVSHAYMPDFLAFAQTHPLLDCRLQAQLHKVLGVA